MLGRRLAGLGLAALGLLGLLIGTPASAQDNAAQERDDSRVVTPRSVEESFYEQIDDLRGERGLAPLRRDADLVAATRAFAVQLRAEGGIRHAADLSVGVTEPWALLGENVGTTDETVDVLFDAFVASPTHLDNLVEPSFDAIGVGVAIAPDGRIFTVHRFMDSIGEPERSDTIALLAEVPWAASSGD